MNYKIIITIIFLILYLLLTQVSIAQNKIIINKLKIPLRDISYINAKNIFLGNINHWEDCSKITIVLYNFKNIKNTEFLKNIGITSTTFNQTIKPKIKHKEISHIFVNTQIEMLSVINTRPNAIGFVDDYFYNNYKDIYTNVKILNIKDYNEFNIN